jgi:hypothetical protein
MQPGRIFLGASQKLRGLEEAMRNHLQNASGFTASMNPKGAKPSPIEAVDLFRQGIEVKSAKTDKLSIAHEFLHGKHVLNHETLKVYDRPWQHRRWPGFMAIEAD